MAPTTTKTTTMYDESYEDEGDFVLYDVETADELRLKTDSVMNGDLMTAGMEVPRFPNLCCFKKAEHL